MPNEAWVRRERVTTVVADASGGLLAIRPIDPEFWVDDGNIEINRYSKLHNEYLAERLAAGEIVYHYTTLEGLRGIVERGVIWASDIRLLNDRSELKYALELMHALLASEKKINEQPLEAVFRPGRAWQFVTCFSRARDQLSQWRAYGSRIGVSVGFHKEHLRLVTAKARGELVECKYLQPADFHSMRKELDFITERLSDPKCLNPQGHLVDMTLQNELTRRVVRIASSIKHPSFSEEQEIRLIASPEHSSSVEFRASAQSLIPYLKLDLDGRRIGLEKRFPYTNHLGMLEIQVFPSSADDQTLDAIDMLLSDGGATLISRSASPYRT